MIWLILFVFGVAIGSFLNVVALRYDGTRFLLDRHALGGRSHCPHCGETLRWFELVPLVSFMMLGARCARCKAPISFQYPVVELFSGLIFALVPWRIAVFAAGTAAAGGVPFVILAALWIIVFEALLVMSLIDIRLGIIPDELNIFLFVAGIFLAIFTVGYVGSSNGSFAGAYAVLFGLQGDFWINRIAAMALAAAFFALLIWITRGRGMGMGDLKLAVPLGLVFGWPDVLLVVAAGSVIGAVVGIILMIAGRKKMKSTVPFGPFLAVGAAVVFFFAYPLFQWYFSAIGLG